MVKYSVIIPVYNEEPVIRETYKRLKKVMEQADGPYELLFVNDGSTDRTMTIIKELAAQDQAVHFLDFSRNFGHQIAITAGMEHAAGEAIVIIDADLQDPPELILTMIRKWQEGYEVVYAKRTKRKGETFFKKQTAHWFYRLLRAVTEIEIPVDTGDFRLIDRKVCDALIHMKERNRFVRGLVSWVGFKQAAIEYERDERFAGETKYPLKKMLRFSMDGITSFSYKPLKLASFLGLLLSMGSGIGMLVVLYLKLFTDSTVAGWSSLLLTTLFFNGVILIILGVIGEYIGRIYDEAKGRPLYIVQEKHTAEREKEASTHHANASY
ncbi:glycosyltransferase family 2 protein [Anoxybacillus rupiensis]|jgi:polyisoprenyl-phosphate glycosyltransferase|uniref:Glycosyltransferase family 2 protein n=1 Tax=Anoxybacteroides rupiense TaxID=311460 RepID=A0ABD5J0V4_9BACL|nr:MULTISPECIES: glycosyltransferase family 2 protein [Anoxybacillus]MBS2773028.1 glycosyltransferase family 2 protein [Anoxybacillus rupiensis]MDE8562286.1 glycosyltransferase family 2 protein [Anoxybacillus rupiensis]MED5053728.1 glycosyltransferase family 2 protein [Anoxybacillus rupiensis]QHC04485.1 glycosyltransferase [Anoxybacillus sp. PDR2]